MTLKSDPGLQGETILVAHAPQKIGQVPLNIYIGRTGASENVFSILFKLLYYMNVYFKYPNKILHHLLEFPEHLR